MGEHPVLKQEQAELTALLVEILRRRYPSQPLHPGEREGWIQVAAEYDPLVLLEAAWEWWSKGTQGFRPSPGHLREIARAWIPDARPYVSLELAMRDWGRGLRPAGFVALVGRFGVERFEALDSVTEVARSRWADVNLAHRQFVHAKELMKMRKAPAWTKAEMGPIALNQGAMKALVEPVKSNDLAGTAFLDKLAGLANTKRLGGAPEAKP
jgi:hypothetical protein